MKKLVLLLPFIFVTQTYAETLAKFEKQLVKQYDQKAFYEVNQEIESAVVNRIKQDPSSFNYSFPAFQDHYNLRIHFSPDKSLKFYTFDIGSGGTMGEFSSYVQTQKAGKTVLTPIDTGFILDVKQTQLSQQPVYFVENYYKASSCMGAYAMNAFKPTQTGAVQTFKVFQTKKAQLDAIQVDFDCKNHESSDEAPDYIRTDKNLNNIDIMLLDKNYKPQGKYLRYSKKTTSYQYMGVVK